MIPLDDSYEHLIDPQSWFNRFTDEDHFKEWCKERMILELMDMIKSCEKRELYEIAGMCQSVIDDKVDFMLGFSEN